MPCTFHPGCAYPEVSDACGLEISGLDGIKATGRTGDSSDFGFAASAPSPVFGTPLKILSADRAWGGNDGPVTWRAVGDALASGSTMAYPFAGKTYFKLPLGSSPIWTARTSTVAWPAPTINDECDRRDGSTPATSSANWASASAPRVRPSYYMCLQNRLLATQRSRPLLIQPNDISRGVEAATDLRVIAGLSTLPASLFHQHPSYNLPNLPAAQNLHFADGTSAYGASGFTGLVSGAPYPSVTAPPTTGTDWTTGKSVPLPAGWLTSPACSAPTWAVFNSAYVTMSPVQNIFGDWDTGPGFEPDGALINLPDAGTSVDPNAAYFSLSGGQVGAATRFSPNALVPSPVIFGSLPAGIDPVTPANSEPWRTLLFCPYPAADAAHPGFAAPPDHLVLDNFWMPVVEPYPLSTGMATAGKINLNDQIAPFTYLHRDTGFYALLHDLRVPAIPVSMANPYKTAGPPIDSIWKPVDAAATIAAWEQRFAAGSVDAYLSESEICTQPIVPLGQTVAGLDAFWNGPYGAGRLTGDNLRELPYAQLYSRLCTRSNSYTVHLRVQVLQKLPGDPQQNVWKEGTDLVLGDWRGSYEIERYLDPAATAPASGPSAAQPLGPYRYRIVSSRRFAP